MSTDTAQLYDQIKKKIAPFVKSWGISLFVIKTLIQAIQKTTLNLRIGFEDSDNSSVGSIQEPFQVI